MNTDRQKEIIDTGRQLAADSIHWFPSRGPIYEDDGKMVPKHLLDEIAEESTRVKLSDTVTQVTIRHYVKE